MSNVCGYIPIISLNSGQMAKIPCDLLTFWQYIDTEYSRVWKVWENIENIWENSAFLFGLCCRKVWQDLHYELPTPPFHLIGLSPSAGRAPSGTGWPGQSARFLHGSHRIYNQSRSVHDTVVARLTPEDIKKAREAKQAQMKPVKQKVGWRSLNHAIIFSHKKNN